MQAEQDRTFAYSFQLPASQTRGRLRVGSRKIAVKVQSKSWQEIKLLTTAKIARKAITKGRCSLEHQGIVCQAIASSQLTVGEGQVCLTLTITSEPSNLSRRIKRITNSSAKSHQQRITGDPMSTICLLAGSLLILLVMPGWGDELGTSDLLTDGITDFCSALSEFFGQFLV